MLQNIGPIGLLLIVIVALILFGPNKLPELGRAFGRTLREFKEGTKELLKDDDKDKSEAEKGSQSAAANRVEPKVVEAEYTEVKSDAPQQSADKQNQDKRLPD